MIELVILYFMFGAGFYCGLAANNPDGFVNASFAGLFRGFLIAFVFWPVGLIFSIVRYVK